MDSNQGQGTVSFDTQTKKIERAKLSILLDKKMTFYSEVMCRLRIAVSEDIPTAATDGTSILLNPEFVDKLAPTELTGLMLHELMHVVYLDVERRKDKDLDADKWNIACDYAINNELGYKYGYHIPKGGYLDRKYMGMSRMDIYDLLPEEDMKDGQADLLDSVSDKDLENIKSIVIQAAISAQRQYSEASIPDAVRQQLESWLNPKLPWHQLLKNYMTARVGTDRDYTRPNKRYWTKYFIPRNISQGLAHIAAGTDVSGSISKDELNIVMSEVKDIVSTLPTTETDVYQWDTQIRYSDTYYSASEFPEEVELHGGGGTNIKCLFDAVCENPPELLIVFTDLEFAVPDFSGVMAAGIDILWLVKGNAPFTLEYGDVIRYEPTA